MARVRKNVWKLKPTDKTLEWYERAVTAMKARPIAEATSWRYQAAIHEYNRATDPFRQSNDVLPTAGERQKYWTQCQHGSWYFLSWHRMYLYHFETIVAAEVEKLGGPADWALPYWNYSDDRDANARLLPTAFRSPKKNDGSDNALFVNTRTPDCNAGRQFADDSDVAIAGPLRERDFVSLSFGTGFGGPQTNFMHSGNLIGSLELTPHGNMHMAVGGLMQSFSTAALDPIFWLHHANIDRLWQVWLDRDASHANPTSTWGTKVKFAFRNAAGKAVTMSSQQVEKTSNAPLFYTYDDTSDPLAKTKLGTVATVGGVKKKTTVQQMVGATKKSFMLDQREVNASLIAKPEVGARAATKATAARESRRIFLNIEKIVSQEPAPSYDVYLNVPEGQDPRKHPQLFIGRLPMFGLLEASRKATSAGRGLHYAFDVTHLYAHMSTLPGWNPTQLRVSFVPARGKAPAKVTVGRVSLYTA